MHYQISFICLIKTTSFVRSIKCMPLHNDDTNCIFNCSTIRKFQLGPFISYSFFVGISLKTAAFNLLLTHLAFSSISTRLGWQQNAKRSELLALWREIKCRHWTHISILWIATEWPKQRHCEQRVKNAIRWHFSNQNKIWISRFNFLLCRVYLSFFCEIGRRIGKIQQGVRHTIPIHWIGGTWKKNERSKALLHTIPNALTKLDKI